MTKDEALTLLKQYLKNENLIKHCIASGAVMSALAEKLGQDKDLWQAAGILHDIDLEIVNGDFSVHGIKAGEILKDSLPQEAIAAIAAHNELSSAPPRSTMFEHALACAETITGLITATSYVYPDKNIASVKPKSIVKRMKEKAFAASVNREAIRECEKLGISLDDFAALALEAMQNQQKSEESTLHS